MTENDVIRKPVQTVRHHDRDPAKAMTLFVMIVATLYFGREVWVPITLALLLAFLLAPIVSLLRRLHFGRVLAVLLAQLVALSVILAIGAVIGSQIAQLSADVPQYVVATETKISTVRAYTVGRLAELADRIGSQRSKMAAHSTASGVTLAPAGIPPTPASTAWSEGGSTPFDLARRFVSPVLSPFLTLGLIVIVAVFALLQQEDLRDRFLQLLGPDDLDQARLGMEDAARRLSRYFLSQMLVNTAFGVVVGLGLLLIGVPNPVLFGILSGLLRFIPYVGSLIAALLPMAMAAAVDPGWWLLVWTGVLYLSIEGLVGQVVEPLLYAHNTGLSPFSVVVAAIFWAWLWGPIGLVLSTPLTMCLVVLGQHVRQLRFLDVMLGDSSGDKLGLSDAMGPASG